MRRFNSSDWPLHQVATVTCRRGKVKAVIIFTVSTSRRLAPGRQIAPGTLQVSPLPR